MKPQDMKKEMKNRKRNSLKNISYRNMVFTGEITTKKTKLLCIPIPYSKGWSAEVDGEAANHKNKWNAYGAGARSRENTRSL